MEKNILTGFRIEICNYVSVRYHHTLNLKNITSIHVFLMYDVINLVSCICIDLDMLVIESYEKRFNNEVQRQVVNVFTVFLCGAMTWLCHVGYI